MSSRTTIQPGPFVAPRPPLAAYRDDLARRGRRSFGPSDATWLSVASVLGHAVGVPPESRPPLLESLREVLRGDPVLSQTLGTAPTTLSAELQELDSVSPIVRAIGQRMEDDGAWSLAYSTLSILVDADLRLSALERGRVLAQMGRIAWQAGALETSRDQYRRVEVLGRAARNAELRVRAWTGYSILARLRGNYPEVRKWATRAVDEAERAGLGALGSIAYHCLMVSSGVAGDFNAALVYGWRAFEGATGDPAREAEMLINVSQFFYETGHADVAVHGFSVALAREPVARVALPGLGGLALAASVLGDATRVRVARAHAERLIATGAMPYEAAATLVELAQALATIGDAAGAAECRARAMEIAARQGYHELTHRVEALHAAAPPARERSPRALDPGARAVARAVSSLDLVASGASTGTNGR
jgi:hypothetical protein